jgi:hypothetical protein
LNDQKFISHHYVLCQQYFKEKSKDEIMAENKLKEDKRKKAEAMKMPYEEE